ncbi:general secretion pathway protein D [alpha proteobacterium U9-1i]|nr:general secretion pathway protein D [alpha proteobacterium U9-1i]
MAARALSASRSYGWAGLVVLTVLLSVSGLQAHAQSPAPIAANEPTAEGQQTAVNEVEPVQHRGTGAFTAEQSTAPPQTPAPTAPEEKLDIRFDNVAVALVVQTLLNDFAHASVVIDPRVQGQITISSQGQITAREVPDFLRTILSAMGYELNEQAPRSYLLRPAESASDGAAAEVYEPGTNLRGGMVIYRLRHVAATEMARLLQPFARTGIVVQPERTRELLFLSGPSDQLQSLLQTIELLDVDWLQGMSFGIVPLEYAAPDPLIAELRTLFGGPDGPIGSMVELVSLPSRRAILVLAKRPERLDQARTWILQLDRPLTTNGRIRFLQIANADAERIAQTVSSLFGATQNDTRIAADATRNALIIQSDPATYNEIEALVRELDRPIDQVMIEVTIAEVALNNDFRFGVQWNFNLRDGTRAILSEAGSGAIVARFPGFAATYNGTYVQAALNALASRTQVDVISSPIVVTLDNQEAVLQVGDEVPIVTQSATNVTTPDATVVNTVQYRETGILLRVTPRIGSTGAVTLEVKQEASEVAPTTTSGIDSPTIQQRRFESTVSVGDGETVALGGLIRANRTRGRSGVPLLGSMPIIGAPFRTTSRAVRRTELIVFLTPRILRSPRDAETATSDLLQRLERVRDSRFIERERD